MFSAAINCMDGRVQLPVNKYMQSKFGFQYVDAITEAGVVKIVAGKEPEAIWENLKKKLQIAVEVHGVKVIGLFAHHDCAGNPISKEEQIKQLFAGKDNLTALYPNLTIIIGWINEKWEVEELEGDSYSF